MRGGPDTPEPAQPAGIDARPGVAKLRSAHLEFRSAGIALADHPGIGLEHPRVSFADIIYDCVIGIEFWSGRTLTIDIPHLQLIVGTRAGP